MTVIASSPSVLHFRLVYPERFRGCKHRGGEAQIFVTFPGKEEVPLPGTVDVRTEHPVDGPASVSVDFVATIEVQYR